MKFPIKSSDKKKPSGRPHHGDDIWAHYEMFKYKRDAATVEKEWALRPGVKARELQDPHRHFQRIKNPTWLGKNDNNDELD
jgi:hypothetical protein